MFGQVRLCPGAVPIGFKADVKTAKLKKPMPRKRAHDLFGQLTRDLARITDDFPDKVLCPLCMSPFSEEAIDSEPPELTLEHIVSELLGEEIFTLSCKSCNNTHGSKVDSHLIQMLRCKDAIVGIGTQPFRGFIEVAGNQIPVHFSIADLTFKVIGAHPHVLSEVHQAMGGDHVDAMEFMFRLGYIRGRAYLALLRIAYLAMFKAFGYEYILSPAAGVIRNIIGEFESPPSELSSLLAELTNISPVPKSPLQLMHVPSAKVTVVVMKLTTETERYYAGLMPDHDVGEDKALEILINARGLLQRYP